MGSIESTVAYGPVYFNTQPNLQTYKDGSGNFTKVIYPPQSSFVLPNNTGITFSAFQKSIEEDIVSISIAEINKLITQNNYLSLYIKVLGEHISSLEKKLHDLTILIKDIKANIAKKTLASTSEGKHEVVLTHVQRPLEIQDFKFGSLNDLEEILDKKFSDLDFKELIDKKLFGLKFKPIDLSQDFADKVETIGDFKNQYSRPTPQNVLIEERDGNQTNTSYSGSEIYEWNLNGLTDIHLTILVHKILMYATICKSVKNIDKTICKMIVAGFTGQLRGWWDNYLNMEEKASIINVIAIDDGVDNLGMTLVRNKEDVVYTFVLTILEHFNGRFTNQHEAHWKARSIDGLPLLLAESVLKALRGSHGEIPYKDYTYGKLIETCTQEGDFCAQFGLPDPSAKSSNKSMYYKSSRTKGSHKKRISRRRSKKERKARKSSCKSHRFTKDRSGRDLSKLNKLKTLELDGETYEKIYGLLYTSGSDIDYESNSGSNIELLDLYDNNTNCDISCITCQGNTCNCEDLLKEVIDSKLREKIINLAISNEASSSSSKPFENKKNDLNDFEYSAPYSLKEVDDPLIKRNAFPEKDSFFDDLKIEIEN
ncbi:hypothetical protein H5410_057067 [Solanum commersonii]|uniref:DUF7746 domain-containing protein n=1 Tax=Solanum commersonii TaxID=4109 RepID=A0A9J5WNM2_SOLCO|nr:hypothetical protein H5410_057067 [Solanum commersonii]